ncbi:predicted protein [Sclerotinia sclerotiorum 1980 UF-70]|uniref:Uncharacterized protein n=1 Tax=Sclerotinia sclerotiorum (strain ATCC 18683 / 1980 / Ss-1) TaxID=665079 RepID=A7F8T6_SCLS1|nr:predicted protein [Sclerotinia sclerotiorum 1980 UF-70]EDN99157.1 predicted protein [Sclerotinia sclerotiorum 1980 UF-70]
MCQGFTQQVTNLVQWRPESIRKNMHFFDKILVLQFVEPYIVYDGASRYMTKLVAGKSQNL